MKDEHQSNVDNILQSFNFKEWLKKLNLNQDKNYKTITNICEVKIEEKKEPEYKIEKPIVEINENANVIETFNNNYKTNSQQVYSPNVIIEKFKGMQFYTPNHV